MIAQLVEHDLAKVGVASSSLVHRSVKILQDLFLHLFSKSHPRWEKLVFSKSKRRKCEPPNRDIVASHETSHFRRSPGGGIGRRVRFRCVCREVCRFESCSGHKEWSDLKHIAINLRKAQVVKLVYTLLWGGSGSNVVWVRVSSCAQKHLLRKVLFLCFFSAFFCALVCI